MFEFGFLSRYFKVTAYTGIILSRFGLVCDAVITAYVLSGVAPKNVVAATGGAFAVILFSINQMMASAARYFLHGDMAEVYR